MQVPNDNPSALRSAARPGLGAVVVGAHRGLAAQPDAQPESPLQSARHNADKRLANRIYERKLIANCRRARAQGMNLMHAAQIEAALQRMPGVQERLATLTARLFMARDAGGDLPELVEEVEKEFGDESEQYLVLHYLGHHIAGQSRDGNGGGGNGSQQQRERQIEFQLTELEDALAELEATKGTRIFAGINAAPAARRFGASAEETGQLVQGFRDMVVGETRFVDAFKAFLKRFADMDFTRGIEFFKRALADDLAAERPSTDKTKLEILLKDLYFAAVAHTLDEETRHLLKVMETQHQLTFETVELTRELADIMAQQWMMPSRFQSLPKRLKPSPTV